MNVPLSTETFPSRRKPNRFLQTSVVSPIFEPEPAEEIDAIMRLQWTASFNNYLISDFVIICSIDFIVTDSIHVRTRPSDLINCQRYQYSFFLGATKHLLNWLSPSVGLSVCLSVTHSFDDPHVAPYWPSWPCFYLIWKTSFSFLTSWTAMMAAMSSALLLVTSTSLPSSSKTESNGSAAFIGWPSPQKTPAPPTRVPFFVITDPPST